MKDELLLSQGVKGVLAARAKDQFRRVLDWVRRQDALSFELRAATSPAGLPRNQRPSADAMALLQPVYGRFTDDSTRSTSKR